MCITVQIYVAYRGCRARPRHLQEQTQVEECLTAKANGHYCPDPEPAIGNNGKQITLASSTIKGECPACPPPLPSEKVQKRL